jgi:hypothetical protein
MVNDRLLKEAAWYGGNTQELTSGHQLMQPLHGATESTSRSFTRRDRCGRTPQCHDPAGRVYALWAPAT